MKKALLVVLALVLVAALSVGLTMAYLTSQDTVTNTFTVGEVKITLDEAPVDVYGEVVAGDRVKANDYKLIPGHTYVKDPKVTVTEGSEECWVFVAVDNGIAGAEAADNTIAAQMTANNWLPLNGVDKVYYYKTTVDAANEAVELPVFGSFKVDNKDVASFDGATITVTAYAVQADTFETPAEAWANAGF